MTTIPEPGATTRKKRRPKDIGTDSERAVVRFLQAHGFPQAERRALRGTQDAGDITGIPGLCVEVKGGNRAKGASDLLVADWLEETEKERINARADIGVLVLQRRGVGPVNAGRWWAVMRANAWILGATKHDFPVRMHLADAVWLLRRSGYGDPLDEEAS